MFSWAVQLNKELDYIFYITLAGRLKMWQDLVEKRGERSSWLKVQCIGIAVESMEGKEEWMEC